MRANTISYPLSNQQTPEIPTKGGNLREAEGQEKFEKRKKNAVLKGCKNKKVTAVRQ